MFCVVRQYKMKAPQQIDQIVETVRGGFLPIVTKVPGYVGYSVALSEQGELITTGFFQDKAAAEDSTRRATDWVRENLADAVDGPPKVTEGEVRAMEMRPGDPSYGALRRAKLQPGKLDEMLDLMRDKLIPLLANVPGFVRVAVVQVGPNETLSLSGWRDRASTQEATRKATEFMQANASSLVTGPPEMIDGEIKFSDVNEAALAAMSS